MSKKTGYRYRNQPSRLLHGVTLTELSKMADIPRDRLEYLVRNGYLPTRPVNHPTKGEVYTRRDVTGLHHWPSIKVSLIAKRANVDIEAVRAVCKERHIKIQHIPVIGSVVSPRSAWYILKNLNLLRGGWTVDRVSLILWLAGLWDEGLKKRVPRFSAIMEKEIHRIAQLPAIQRVEQIVMLLNKWRDAEEIILALREFAKDDDRREETLVRMRMRMEEIAGLRTKGKKQATKIPLHMYR